MAKDIERYIQLKQIVWKKRNRADFTPPRIDDILEQLWRKCPTAGSRHHPELPLHPLDLPKRCGAIDMAMAMPQGFGFRYTSYQPGRLPASIDPDFTGKDLKVEATPIRDSDGRNRDMAGTAMVIGWNQIMLVEASRGAGGCASLENCLNGLIARYISPGLARPLPTLRLTDVADHAVVAMLRRGGGAVEVVVGLSTPRDDPKGRYAKQVSALHREVKNTGMIRVTQTATKGLVLEEEAVLEALEELEHEEVDGVRIILRDGERLIGNNKCKIMSRVTLQDVGGGHHDPLVLLREMGDYLLKLQAPHDGVAVVTEDGQLADVN